MSEEGQKNQSRSAYISRCSHGISLWLVLSSSRILADQNAGVLGRDISKLAIRICGHMFILLSHINRNQRVNENKSSLKVVTKLVNALISVSYTYTRTSSRYLPSCLEWTTVSIPACVHTKWHWQWCFEYRMVLVIKLFSFKLSF